MKGVRRFEASFTYSPDSLEALRRSTWVLAVHFHEKADAIVRAVESAGGQRVYQSFESSPIKIAKRDHPANTNPLVFKGTMLFVVLVIAFISLLGLLLSLFGLLF